jgi:hypothetical protein
LDSHPGWDHRTMEHIFFPLLVDWVFVSTSVTSINHM